MAKKITLKSSIERFQKEMLLAHDRYMTARNELSQYEGKLVDEIGLDKVNNMLEQIRLAYAELHPALHFIHIYTQFATNNMNNHAAFINALKQQGATEVDNTPQKENTPLINIVTH